MSSTDKMLTRLAGEIEEKQTFIDGIVQAAENDHRDLTSQEMEMVTRSRDRLGELNAQAGPMQEAARIASESRARIEQIGKLTSTPDTPREVSYRSAGQYVLDYWKGSLGAADAMQRLDLYNRAASHQTTADNPGLLPTPIVEPIVNFIDTARPLTTWLGPRQIPSNSWTRPKVTQHTNVAAQPVGEKNELVSQKMTISKTAVTANTYGGYVNVSRQDIDWTTPSIMDLVISDLAAQYGIVTEAALCAACVAGATAGLTIPTGVPTPAALAAALWDAAAKAYTATKGQGRLGFFIAPDMLALWGGLFAPINPVTAQSAGFEAANFGSGLMGAISGIPVYMDAGLAAGSNLVISSAAVEVYEDRIGSLQVVEPSVLGVQVAYAGYYTWWIADTGGVIKIVKTP
jgi:HK97 family phage major capsid protein